MPADISGVVGEGRRSQRRACGRLRHDREDHPVCVDIGAHPAVGEDHHPVILVRRQPVPDHALGVRGCLPPGDRPVERRAIRPRRTRRLGVEPDEIAVDRVAVGRIGRRRERPLRVQPRARIARQRACQRQRCDGAWLQAVAIVVGVEVRGRRDDPRRHRRLGRIAITRRRAIALGVGCPVRRCGDRAERVAIRVRGRVQRVVGHGGRLVGWRTVRQRGVVEINVVGGRESEARDRAERARDERGAAGVIPIVSCDRNCRTRARVGRDQQRSANVSGIAGVEDAGVADRGQAVADGVNDRVQRRIVRSAVNRHERWLKRRRDVDRGTFLAQDQGHDPVGAKVHLRDPENLVDEAQRREGQPDDAVLLDAPRGCLKLGLEDAGEVLALEAERCEALGLRVRFHHREIERLDTFDPVRAGDFHLRVVDLLIQRRQ